MGCGALQELAIKVYKTAILVFKDRDRCAHFRGRAGCCAADGGGAGNAPRRCALAAHIVLLGCCELRRTTAPAIPAPRPQHAVRVELPLPEPCHELPCPPAPSLPLRCAVHRRYVVGDSRFQRYCKSNPRKMVKLWAEKEMRNLMRLHAAGIPCPKPLQVGA